MIVGTNSCTVTITLSVTPFASAVIIAVPAFFAVIFPLLTEATLVLLLFHFTALFRPVTRQSSV